MTRHTDTSRWPAARRLARAAGGNSAIEFALVAPVFLLMLFGIVEFGRLCWMQASLQYAVETAARCGSLGLPQCATTADIQTYAAANIETASVAADAFSVSNCANGGTEVSVSVPFASAVPSLFPWKFTLASASCYPNTQGS